MYGKKKKKPQQVPIFQTSSLPPPSLPPCLLSQFYDSLLILHPLTPPSLPPSLLQATSAQKGAEPQEEAAAAPGKEKEEEEEEGGGEGGWEDEAEEAAASPEVVDEDVPEDWESRPMEALAVRVLVLPPFLPPSLPPSLSCGTLS